MNLLLTRNADELKVTDFGISKVVARHRAPGGDKPYMSGGVGTWRYMAPEVARHEQYTDRADIFSFALIMWFMTTGRQPFVDQFGKSAEAVLVEYGKGHHPRPRLKGMRCTAAYSRLVEEAWHRVPDQRPSAESCARRLDAIMQEESEQTGIPC